MIFASYDTRKPEGQLHHMISQALCRCGPTSQGDQDSEGRQRNDNSSQVELSMGALARPGLLLWPSSLSSPCLTSGEEIVVSYGVEAEKIRCAPR